MIRHAIIAAWLGIAAPVTADPAPPPPAPVPSVPRGSKPQGPADTRGVQRYTSSVRLRPACKALAALAAPRASRYLPMTQIRSTLVCRLVSDDPRTSWAAVHVYQVGRDATAKPTIAIVPRSVAGSAPSP